MTNPERVPTELPQSFVRLALVNLAAQSAEQLSLAAVPLAAVIFSRVSDLHQLPQQDP